MKLTERFQQQLDREVERTDRILKLVPEGRDDWRPHPKSMPLGQLVNMLAGMPAWLRLILTLDELDLEPDTPRHRPEPGHTRVEWAGLLASSAASARAALNDASDERLETSWTLKAHGKPVNVMTRADMLTDTLAHLSHHRGQLTVYLRLLDATVPALYGPSADDRRYGLAAECRPRTAGLGRFG